jgi:hypothetical protein
MNEIEFYIEKLLNYFNVYASNNTPESVILGFAAAMQNGDIEKAKSYLDKKSFIKPKNIMKPQLGTKDTLEREINLFNSFLLYTDSENGNAHNPKDWTIKVEKNTNGHNNYELYLINSQLKKYRYVLDKPILLM